MNRLNYWWNPVFRAIMNIKDDFCTKFGYISYEKMIVENKELSCVEYWVYMLNSDKYNKLFSILQTNQYGNMVLFRYGQYANIYSGENEIAPEEIWDVYDGFYRECRSLVIDVKNENIVLSPFKKFRNLNEGEENSLENIRKKLNNAKSVEITNKLDGSMQSARFYNGEIVMSGSQAIDPANSWRLQDGYKKVFNDLNYIRMISENPEFTFIFEYITLEDAHVVSYKEEEQGLYLIGMRNVFNGEQLSYNQVRRYSKMYNVKMTKIFDKTFDEVMNETQIWKSNEMEGFVINIDGFMFKLKCDDYVKIHRILSNISSINLIIKNIADGTFDDLISKVPEVYKYRVSKVSKMVFDYIRNTDKIVKDFYNKAPKNSRKDFMIYVDKNVPKCYNGYVKDIYLGKEFNYIKTNGKDPHYKTMKEMGYTGEYSAIFSGDSEYE